VRKIDQPSMVVVSPYTGERAMTTTDSQSATDRSVELNGLRFHYLDWGNASAQPLICLHGFTSHAHTWDTFARSVRERYWVLALDQRGHGETEWATDYHPARRVEDLEAFVAALRIERPVLVGLSMGGRVAFQYAARHPESVERLVIVDSAPETAAAGAQRITTGIRANDVFDDPDDAFAAARAANQRPADADLRERVRHGLMQQPDGKWTFRYDVTLRNGSGARVMSTPEEVRNDWESLKGITCPTLLVRGSESDVLSPELAQRFVDSVRNARLIEVADSGHSVPLDNPRGFIESVRGFV
jgi:pimeloyl-ACP methyl ester carboxylesterase